MKKERMDALLVERGLAETLDQARRLIMAGLAVADDKRIDKAGDMVPRSAVLRLKEKLPYVSRGGFKLQGAVEAFCLDMKGARVIDIGSSTGGFTDAALKNGASEVFAVDVGRALLHESLRRDPRVTVVENTNFRTIVFDAIGAKADFIVTDVSFISLAMIIPAAVQFCFPGTVFVPLIKPQFEAERHQVGSGGIVADKDVHRQVCLNMIRCASGIGFGFRGLAVSPVTGAKGNIEYLAYFVYNEQSDENFIRETIKRVI